MIHQLIIYILFLLTWKKLLCNKKHISTLCSLKNVSNADKQNFMKDIFIPGKPFGFLEKMMGKVIST